MEYKLTPEEVEAEGKRYPQVKGGPGSGPHPGSGGVDKQHASTPNGKTEYAFTTASNDISKIKRGEKEAKQKAMEHAKYLMERGHKDVKVTRRYTAHTIPGRGIGGTTTFTVHHGLPDK